MMTSPPRTALVRVARPGRSPRRGLRSFLRKPLGMTAALYLTLVVVVAVLAPMLAPYEPVGANLRNVLQGPSAQHWLGTDSLGQDVLSRLMFGARDSLIGVVQAVVTWLAVGVPLGVASGYIGGRFDRFVTRTIDVVLAVPSIIVTLTVLAIFNSSMLVAMVTIGLLASANLARVVRGRVLSVREELYIDSAKVLGLPTPLILLRHVLPRTMGVIIVQAALFSAIALGVQTGLAFLAFGPPPPAPTWGGMMAEATTFLQRQPWLLVPSGVAIGLTAMAFGLLGDAVRDLNAERSAGGRRASRRRGRSVAAPSPAHEADAGAVLSVRGLSVSILGEQPVPVVEGVSFDIQPGETVGLVGESGSGKTVTALALLDLLPSSAEVTAGSIRYGGRELAGLNAREYAKLRGREIAMISQEPMVALDPSFRIGAQVAEVVRAHRRCSRREAHRRAVELFAMVSLPDPEAIAKKYPHQISGGQAQRVAIAAALAGDPKLLIADEPTTALDVTVQAGILDLLMDLQAETGMAILLVTHDWGVVADVCTRAVVMYAGEVVERASVDEVFARPKHPYTRGLLASNPHNTAKGERLPSIGGVVPAPGDRPRGCHFAPRCAWATEECREAPIPEVDAGAGRMSRCIRIDELLRGRPEPEARTHDIGEVPS